MEKDTLPSWPTSSFRLRFPLAGALALLSCCWACCGCTPDNHPPSASAVLQNMEMIRLPSPRTDGHVAVERALNQRRSLRDFSATALTLDEVGQLLWSAQGVTHPEGRRTAPSAGAIYPLELTVVVGNVTGLGAGVYRYIPAGHSLAPLAAGDKRADLARAALGQSWMQKAPMLIVFGGIEARITPKYGQRGISYIYIEVGHAAQNVLLQAAATGLGATGVGAFDNAAVAALLQMPEGEKPLYLMPVGKPVSLLETLNKSLHP